MSLHPDVRDSADSLNPGTSVCGAVGGSVIGQLSGTDDTTMTFEGTVPDINVALDGLVFTPGSGWTGPATLTVSSSDLGSSGTGGTLTDNDTITITIG